VGHHPELSQVIASSRDLLIHDDIRNTPDENARVRRWALGFLHRVFAACDSELGQRLEHHRASGRPEWPQDELANARKLANLEHAVVREVHLASKAFQEEGSEPLPEASPEVNRQARRDRLVRFASEADPLLEALCSVRSSHDAYDLLKALHHLQAADPKRMFLLIGRLIRSSTADSFQYEELAVNEVVKIVEQYLAEHRGLFRSDRDMLDTLLDVLDLFVDAGWPQALNLIYRLDEVF
jgi:hypothetical protein